MNMTAQKRSAIGERNPTGLREWLVACCVAVALHAGAVAMLLVQGGSAASEENFGAMAIEVGIENVAPSFDSTEAPEVSDAPATTAAVASNEATAAHEEAAPPAVTQVADADQRVATPTPEHEEQPEKEAAQASPAAAAAPSAGAPSRLADRESVQSVAASIGSSAEAQRARAAWRRGLVAHIERQKRYPAGAERSANIVVSFSIDHQGRLTAVEIAKGSGDARYDQAAIDMVRRAAPMPPPPPDLPEQNLSFRIPISFRAGG